MRNPSAVAEKFCERVRTVTNQIVYNEQLETNKIEWLVMNLNKNND